MLVLQETDVDFSVADGLTGTDWLVAGAILVGSVIVSVLVRQLGRRLIERAAGPGFAAVLISRLLGLVVILFGLVYALSQLGVAVGPLLGALGLSGLVLALALQSLVENLVAGLIISTRRPFSIGDTVEVCDGRSGVVTDLDTRAVRLETPDGVVVEVPNSSVLTHPIVNLTANELRRSTLVVGVAYDSDLDRVIAVLDEAVNEVPGVAVQPAPTVQLSAFGSSTIDIEVRYWHGSTIASELGVRNDVALAIHHATESNGIVIAFPQVVVWTGQDRSDGGPYAQRNLDQVIVDPTPLPAEHQETKSRLGRLRWR